MFGRNGFGQGFRCNTIRTLVIDEKGKREKRNQEDRKGKNQKKPVLWVEGYFSTAICFPLLVNDWPVEIYPLFIELPIAVSYHFLHGVYFCRFVGHADKTVSASPPRF